MAIPVTSDNITVDLTDVIIMDGYLDWMVNPIHLDRGMYGHDALAITVRAMRRKRDVDKYFSKEVLTVLLDECHMKSLIAAIVYFYGEHGNEDEFREMVEKELEYWGRE